VGMFGMLLSPGLTARDVSWALSALPQKGHGWQETARSKVCRTMAATASLTALAFLRPRHLSSGRWQHRRCTARAHQGAGELDQSWCAVFINLHRRADRRLRLAHLLAAENPVLLSRLRRIDAVDGRGLDLADSKRLRPFVTAEAVERAQEAKQMGAHTIVHKDGQLVKFNDHFTEGGIACAMSHRAALQAVASHPTADWGLIIEDDIQDVVPNVHEVIQRAVKQLPANWDALFLGYHGATMLGKGPGGRDTKEEMAKARLELDVDRGRGHVDGFHGSVGEGQEASGHLPVLRMYSPLYGLFAWAVRKEAAKAMVESGFPVEGQVDFALSGWLVRERGNAFKVAPYHTLFFSPKSEVGLDSDIQTMATLEEMLADPERCEEYMSFCERTRSW